jgi:membrane protease YdiL (CAAX protease family)
MPRPQTDPSVPPRTDTTPFEAAVVAALCFGWAIVLSLGAARHPSPAAGYSDASMVVTIAIEAGVAAATLAFLALRGYAVAALRPAPTWRDSALGVGQLVASSAAAMFVVMPFAAQWSEQPIRQMMAQTHVSLPVVVAAAFVNGAFEETFLLGVLTRGLRRLGPSTALGLPLLVRLLYHTYQGPLGTLSVTVFGLVLGLFFLRTGRLWPAVVAHVLADILPFLGALA